MKKINFRFLVIAITLFVFSPFTWAGTQFDVSVNGMVCQGCIQSIESKLKAEDAIKTVEVSLKKALVQIEFKEGQKLSQSKIKELIKDAGYDVGKIKVTQ